MSRLQVRTLFELRSSLTRPTFLSNLPGAFEIEVSESALRLAVREFLEIRSLKLSGSPRGCVWSLRSCFWETPRTLVTPASEGIILGTAPPSPVLSEGSVVPDSTEDL